MKFDYHRFLDKPQFVSKYNIDLEMKRLLVEDVKTESDDIQNPLSDAEGLLNIYNDKTKSFIAVLLCGGKAVRFNSRYKAVFEIPNAIKNNENPTFLELNIMQIITYEKKYNLNIPVVIYDDFATRGPIKKLLKSKNYFGKNRNDFVHVMQTSWFRYLPDRSMLDKFKLTSQLTAEQLTVLPSKPEVYRTKNIIDSVVGTGHFVFNSLVTSKRFKNLIRSRTEISKIVVSNCDNLGKKYFPELVENDGLNYPIVTNRTINERMVVCICQKIRLE